MKEMQENRYVSFFGTTPMHPTRVERFGNRSQYKQILKTYIDIAMPIYLKNKQVNNKVHFHRTYGDRIPKKNMTRIYHDADFIHDIRVVIDVYEKRHLTKIDKETGEVIKEEWYTYYYIIDFGYKIYFWSDVFDELHMEELGKLLDDVVMSFEPIKRKYDAVLSPSTDAD